MPESSISIRPAVESDVPLILSFIGALAEYEKLTHLMSATEELLHEHLFGPSPAAAALMGFVDGQPAGFALHFQAFSTFMARPVIWLEDLFVLPKFRRLGLGKALLKHLAAEAVRRKCGRMEWAVLDWNEPARKFYQSIGAEMMNDWTTHRLTGDALKKLAGEA